MTMTRSHASTLHLQMGQEVMYLLLVTSLIANFVLATLALRTSKQATKLSAPSSFAELVKENKDLRQERDRLQGHVKELEATVARQQTQQKEADATIAKQQAQIKDLQGKLERQPDQAKLIARNQEMEEALKRAEQERAQTMARAQQAEEKNKSLEAERARINAQLKTMEALLRQNQRPNDQPPIINLREADGFSFSPGSTEVSPDFTAKLAQEVVPKLAALSLRYGAQIVEVIGHTDGTLLRDTSRRLANLDDSLGQYLDPTSTTALIPYDNVGLGIARAVSVARALRASGLPAALDIQTLSAAYLIAPNDKTDPASRKTGDASRRRIEIRIRRIGAN